ncbi:hypothetical protein [Hydrogenophaga sp.]|uniref:hypothetical protein n=1 Tax=Hydrogenophaga sp. TaxID=1904254 RepID=UPI00199B589F|nr:hypothetical protein [Hydrogenophaga sp.]MBD3893648.1 hypothetical protein [Hydrogenophaga sp.]
MTNLTISIDAAIVRQARIRAIQEGTSVSAKVREFLSLYSTYRDKPAPAPCVAAHLPVFPDSGGLQTGSDPCSKQPPCQAAQE